MLIIGGVYMRDVIAILGAEKDAPDIQESLGVLAQGFDSQSHEHLEALKGDGLCNH
jgi:hypothetical protein